MGCATSGGTGMASRRSARSAWAVSVLRPSLRCSAWKATARTVTAKAGGAVPGRKVSRIASGPETGPRAQWAAVSATSGAISTAVQPPSMLLAPRIRATAPRLASADSGASPGSAAGSAEAGAARSATSAMTGPAIFMGAA